jgi:leader peptidase (prepilin peptidase)/N-methyltransferase
MAILLAVASVDGRRQVIPDFLNAALLAVGLLRSASHGLESLIAAAGTAALVFSAFFLIRALHYHLRGIMGLGLGDVKFLAAASAWIGVEGLSLAVLAASLSGLLYVLVRSSLLATGLSGSARIAFGPHLSLGLAVVWISGGYV